MSQPFLGSRPRRFFASADDAEQLLIRRKEVTDGAIPSGNSVALHNLLNLSLLTGDVDLEQRAGRLVQAFSGLVHKAPSTCTFFLSALDLDFGIRNAVVIVTREGDEKARSMLQALDTAYLPHTVRLLKTRATADSGLTGHIWSYIIK